MFFNVPSSQTFRFCSVMSSLFNDSVGVTRYIISNVWWSWIVNRKWCSMKQFWPNFKYYPKTFLGGTEGNHVNLRIVGVSSRNLKQPPPKYKSGALLLAPCLMSKYMGPTGLISRSPSCVRLISLSLWRYSFCALSRLRSQRRHGRQFHLFQQHTSAVWCDEDYIGHCSSEGLRSLMWYNYVRFQWHENC
jgi:hypothetical protein